MQGATPAKVLLAIPAEEKEEKPLRSLLLLFDDDDF